jgi:hypothetical protein
VPSPVATSMTACPFFSLASSSNRAAQGSNNRGTKNSS